MLTKKQQLLLQFIHERLQAEGVPPSFEEMKEALDLKSKSGIHRLITALEERGFIRRLPNRARALEVIKMPESWGSNDMGTSVSPAVPPAQQTANDNVAMAGTNSNPGSARSGTAMAAKNQQFAANRQSANNSANDNAGFEVPVMGKIAAGVPIAAIQHETHSVMVPPGMIGTGEHYALTIEGDSMIEAGIHDGDTVIIRQGDTARAGEIVVALVDDEEATLKTFRRDGQDIVLEAANPAHENRRYPANRVQVQGKLVGLIRQYH